MLSADKVISEWKHIYGLMLKKVLTCPHCGSASLYYEAGLVTGYKYHCKDCDYVGAFVIEKDIPPTNGKKSR